MSLKAIMLPGSVSRRAGGLFTSVRRLSECLSDSDSATVEVVGHTDDSTATDLSSWKNPPHLLKSKNRLGLVRELIVQLEKIAPDIVHTQFLWSYGSAATLKWVNKKSGRLHMISPRGMLDPWALRQSRIKKRIAGSLFESRHLRSAGCLHALCRSEADAIRKAGLTNPVCTIPNGIDLPYIARQSIANGGDADGRKRMLFLGRIHPKKGLFELIRAWSSAAQHLKDWKLTIAGWDDGGHLNGLQELVNDCNLDRSIDFFGPAYGEEKERLLSAADAFILPSFSEGLPMSVLEAWAYRLPVLMTNECNLPEGFSQECALKVKPDESSLARSLVAFSNANHVDRFEMGMRGRQLVERSFTWEKVASQMRDVYLWQCGAGVQPDCVITLRQKVFSPAA